MKRLHYVEIENFKTFGKRIKIDLDHPAVLIGPNNAGKTSVIQALALWNRGIQAWYEKKGQPRKEKLERLSAGINRLNILEIPVAETRFFWNNTRVRKANQLINMIVNVGIEHQGQVKDCRLNFTQRDSEVMYCRPDPEIMNDLEFLSEAAGIRFNLLYPMSGIEIEEPLIQEGRLNVLMGMGQTAQVLRNLCYKVVENDRERKTSDWKSIVSLMNRLFAIDMKTPQLNSARGNLVMKYRQYGVENDLDIALAGRGLQQFLLVLAYLYAHKGSILMIDEPDAHLEILRQKQVYSILKEIAQRNDCQVIIATHSEVIIPEAADTNLTLLINGEAINLATQNDMKNALRTFGIDHYYKARAYQRILYIEGSTDLEILTTLAHKLGHRAYDILSGELNYYYTQDVIPEETLAKTLEKYGGAYIEFKRHFSNMKRFEPNLKGIAIFDSDGRNVQDEMIKDLAIIYWKDYEIENYFITPEFILDYIEHYFSSAGSLFQEQHRQTMQEVIDRWLLKNLFSGDESQLREFYQMSRPFRRTLLKNQKMSRFAEDVFKEFADTLGQPVLLSKGEYYRLIENVSIDDIPKEVTEKLDLLVEYLG